MHGRKRLLITSVGSLVGQNILDGLAHCRDSYTIVGLNSEADAVSNFLCDRVYLTPPVVDKDAFRARFEAVLQSEQPDLVIPGRDDDVVFLAQWASGQTSLPQKVMVGRPQMAVALRDKWLTCRFAKDHGLPFVDTRCSDDGFHAVLSLAEQYGWPLVAKPRTGNASRGVLLVEDVEHLQLVFTWPGYCFQPWLGARPELQELHLVLQGGLPLDWALPKNEMLSLDGWIDPSGEVGGGFCSFHQEVKAGRTERLAVVDSAVAKNILSAYADALRSNGWRGPFNIQLRDDAAGHPVAFELNGRFTGSSASLRWLGLDFVGSSIAAFVGNVSRGGELMSVAGRIDKRLRDWPMQELAVEKLLTDGVWSG